MARPGKREPRTLLEYLLIQQDRTYEEAATDFVAFARQLGEPATLSPRHLGRLARGERDQAGTTPVTRRVLQAMFGRPIDDLLRPWAGQAGLAAEPYSGDPATPARSADERRVLSMAAQRARRFATIAGQDNAPAEVIDQLHDDVHHLAMAYPQRPLHEILGDLVDLQDTLFALLEQRQRPQRARELYFLGSVVGGLLAKASHDLGEPHAAMAQARTAYLCAENADHDGLRGWLRGLQSFVAYWAGRHQESIRYAQNGVEHAGRVGNTASVWLPANEARAWAALGNAAEAKAAISRAQTAWDHVQPDDLDELGGICTFNRSRTLYYAADAFAWLPSEAAAAGRYSQQAVTAYEDTNSPDWAFGDQAGSRADLTIARIAGRDIEGATEALEPVLALPAEQRINGVIHSVQRVGRAITDAGLATEGRDLRDEIEMFARTPLKALPR